MTIFQKRFVLLVAVALALVSVTLAVLMASPRPAAQEAAATAPQCKYIVGQYAGYVAVYLAGHEEPSYVTETRVAVLPAADRALLEAGIPVQTEEALSLLLEDYGS